jgi:DNA-binding MarR family transcriptional regulator
MTTRPDEPTVAAWIGLSRAQRVATACVEARLKAEGLPPLSWYDALWELEKAGEAGLRPFELERAMLFEQYNLSRLAHRLAEAGLIDKQACQVDARGQTLKISPAGRELRRRMWEVYSGAIEEAVGAKLSPDEATSLAELLRKLE